MFSSLYTVNIIISCNSVPLVHQNYVVLLSNDPENVQCQDDYGVKQHHSNELEALIFNINYKNVSP